MTAPTSEHGHESGQDAQADHEPASDSTADGTVAAPEKASPRPVAFDLRTPGPVLQGLIALAIYLSVWLLGWFLPVLLHPNETMLDQPSMDPNFYVWSLRWWPYAVSHGLNPLQTKEIGAPAGFNMTWTTTVPPLALIASPLTLLVGAMRSYSVLTAIAPAVSAWAAFVACRRLTGKFWAALVGGAFYGFSSYETGHTVAGQLNLTWTLLLPLMVYLVVLWRDQKLSRGWFVSLMALAMVLQFFVFDETFFEMTAVLAIGLPLGYALAGRANRRAVARLARHLSAAWVIAMALVSPYLIYALSNYPSGFSRSPATSELNLAAMVVPRPTGSFGIGGLMHYATRLSPLSEAGYIGLPALVIVVALAVLTWHSKITRFLVIMFVVVFVLAAGPSLAIGKLTLSGWWVPWEKLWFLPVARSAEPVRFSLIGCLALAAIVTIWLAAPVRTLARRAARWAVALLAAAAILANVAPTAFDAAAARDHIPAFFTTGEYRHYIKPGEIVVVISARGNAAMLFQAYTNFYMRVAGGYINMALTPRSDLPTDVINLSHADQARDAQFLAYLKTGDVGAIIVERDWKPRWVGILGKLGLKGTKMGGVVFYPVGPCVTSCRPADHGHHATGHPA
jgi:hypothetical protein